MEIYHISVFAVYDLLVSPDCLPDLLQGGLKNKNVNDVYILTTFQVLNKAPVRVFRIYNPTDNSDHFDFTIYGKFNKGTFSVLRFLKKIDSDWDWIPKIAIIKQLFG